MLSLLHFEIILASVNLAKQGVRGMFQYSLYLGHIVSFLPTVTFFLALKYYGVNSSSRNTALGPAPMCDFWCWSSCPAPSLSVESHLHLWRRPWPKIGAHSLVGSNIAGHYSYEKGFAVDKVMELVKDFSGKGSAGSIASYMSPFYSVLERTISREPKLPIWESSSPNTSIDIFQWVPSHVSWKGSYVTLVCNIVAMVILFQVLTLEWPLSWQELCCVWCNSYFAFQVPTLEWPLSWQVSHYV